MVRRVKRTCGVTTHGHSFDPGSYGLAMSDLTVGAGDLREASERLDRAVPGRRLRSPCAMHAAELASDILVVVPLLDEARETIVSAWREEEAVTQTTVILKIPGTRADNADARRLFSFTKAFYLFVRAYHDSLYGVLFELATGNPAGDRRMQKAAHQAQNPVGEVIREHLPEYFDWFERWRAQRNAIKDGVGFSTVGPIEDLGVAFTDFTDFGGVRVSLHNTNIVRVSDLVAALSTSAALTNLAASKADRATAVST